MTKLEEYTSLVIKLLKHDQGVEIVDIEDSDEPKLESLKKELESMEELWNQVESIGQDGLGNNCVIIRKYRYEFLEKNQRTQTDVANTEKLIKIHDILERRLKLYPYQLNNGELEIREILEAKK